MAVKYLERKSVMTKRKVYRRKSKRGPKKSLMGIRNIRAVVNKVLGKKMETKQSTATTADNTVITHNNFITVENKDTFFRIVNGTGDDMTGDGNRIGDEINLKGISLKMMIEMNMRFSDVSFRLMLIKSGKGDTPTRASLYRGLSNNKMLDSLNTERYTIVFQKYFKITAQNTGTSGAQVTAGAGTLNTGTYVATSDVVQSRATKIIRVYIPGSKFGRNGRIQYEDLSSTKIKFFDYSLVLYAYSNYTTSQDFVDVALINDYVKTMYFTDA